MPSFLTVDNIEKNIQNMLINKITEIEITGGGEPLLNDKLQDIINILKHNLPNVYIKLYTNGFLLKPLYNVDEINISRCHWDTLKNNEIYNCKNPNDLNDVIEYYRLLVKKIRLQTVLLKGYIDTIEKMQTMVDMFPTVDVFMFRPLFSKCDREKEKYIDISLNYPRVKMDITGDSYDNCFTIDMNGNWIVGLPWKL